MDDRPGVHQRAGQAVAAILDAWISLADHGERAVLVVQRKHARRQPRRPHGNSNLARPVLAGKVGQGAGFGEGDLRLRAGVADSLGHQVAAEGARRQEDHLSVGEMRRHRPGDIGLGKGRRRADDQVDATDRLTDIRGDGRNLDLAAALEVLQRQPVAGCVQRLDTGHVASPEAYAVALFGQIDGGGVRAVATTQYGDVHEKTDSGFTWSRGSAAPLPAPL